MLNGWRATGDQEKGRKEGVLLERMSEFLAINAQSAANQLKRELAGDEESPAKDDGEKGGRKAMSETMQKFVR